jgi:hypothetical protein
MPPSDYDGTSKVMGYGPPTWGDVVTRGHLAWIAENVDLSILDKLAEQHGWTRHRMLVCILCELHGWRQTSRTWAEQEADRLLAVADVLQS